MRKEISDKVRKVFREHVAMRIPSLTLNSKWKAPAGCDLYTMNTHEEISCHILLLANKSITGDRFNLEGIVAESSKNPLDAPNTFTPLTESSNFFLFRLSRLWDSTSTFDTWWEICPTPTLATMLTAKDEPLDACLGRVNSIVSDAVEKIEKYAIPFFQHKGCKV